MKLSDLKEGMSIHLDAGFTCIKEGNHSVHETKSGDFYVRCADGKHFLDRQEDENGELVGISYVPE